MCNSIFVSLHVQSTNIKIIFRYISGRTTRGKETKENRDKENSESNAGEKARLPR